MAAIRYGIVGAGMMGREHMLNISHLPGGSAAVTCVADPHPLSRAAALELASSLGGPSRSPPLSFLYLVFSSHGELLESGLCDVVVVSSPNMTHFGILMDILRHPRAHHVLVEKPLCTTVHHCKQIMAAAKARPEVLVHVGLEYRFMPPVAKLLQVMVAIREHRFPFLVKIQCQHRGTLVEKCCHFFDLMRLFAAADPVRVMASGAIDVNHKDEVYDGKVPDIIDNAFVIVEFDNGARGMLDLCMFAEGSKNEQEISVVGDIGKGEAFVPEGIVRLGTRAGGRDGVQTSPAADVRIKAAGSGGAAPTVDLRDGLLSVAIGVAGQLSIEQGRFVSIEEVLS
ncbi:unnamed protein product [Spirodela intermedia]|uniref:Uncharacterized protein n=1 Tax=Spirodela intermedia TaxID=51605 RepID=A0A7I8IZ79_SPIIN|nr:unnamed protein product [Spirodela intermedia]CAA6663286.1 unnamed protein product [Spirodela intermedia]